MIKPIRIFFFISLALTLAAPAQAGPLKRLAKKLIKGLDGQANRKIAVLSFPYHDGKLSSGSTIIRERLTTYLAEGDRVEVIERKLLKKVLKEMKLERSGLIDEETTNRLGKILGVGAVVTGTLNDLKRDRTEVNARLVETETGKILAARMTKISRTWKDAPVAAGPAPEPGTGPKPPGGAVLGKSLVQMAILLDTSNSMDGLISQAKSQLWRIVNELASAEKKGNNPDLQVALYEYGNDSLSEGEHYIRQLQPFTSDLDKVSEDLFALKTNGGQEYAGAVLRDAVDGLQWAEEIDVYKAIFIAGNEPFTQGPVDFRGAVAKAKARGIFVNTIYCGPRQRGIATQWKAGADLGGGEYLHIDQERKAVAIRAPQDDEITRLGRKLNKTYIPYGRTGRRNKERQRAQDMKAEAFASYGSAVQRSVFKSRRQYSGGANWDAASLVGSGKKKVSELEEDALPAEMRAMNEEERSAYIKKNLEERRSIQKRIKTLNTQRKSYVAELEKKRSGGLTLDQAVLKAVRKQAAGKDFKFR